MEDVLRHLRTVHFVLLLTAAVTAYFNFSQNTQDLRLKSNLIWMLREGPFEGETFADLGQEYLIRYPYIRRNYSRLSYRRLDEIPAIISELDRSGGSESPILGVNIHRSYVPIMGSLAQLFILCYLYVVVRNIRAALKGSERIPEPVPWVGAMRIWQAKILVWVTLVLVPTGSSIFAFLYYADLSGIVLVSLPIFVIGVLVSRESGRLSNSAST